MDAIVWWISTAALWLVILTGALGIIYLIGLAFGAGLRKGLNHDAARDHARGDHAPVHRNLRMLPQDRRVVR